MIKKLAGVVAAMLLVSLPMLAPSASAAAAKCHGKKATIVGSAGDDTLVGTRRADVIFAGAGNDFVFAKGGNDILCGGSGTDSLNGQSGKDKMYAQADADYLYPGPGNDLVVGGGGLDIVDYHFAKAGVIIDLSVGAATGEGNDTLRTLEGAGGTAFDDRITGSDVGETIQGGDGADVISTGGSVDVIAPGGGNDTIDGGDGVDLLVYLFSLGPVQVNLATGTATGEGDDTFTGIEGTSDSTFADTVVGNDEQNLLLAGPGDDHVDGGGGFDWALYWLADQPTDINLATGKSTGYGADTLANIEGAWGSLMAPNKMTGDGGNNAFLGGLVNDEMFAGGGDDLLQGYLGDDLYDGGAGAFDGAIISSGAIRADLNAGTATGEGSDTLVGIEALEGSPFADVLIGNSAGNVIYGGAGDDELNGGGGADFLSGGDGSDKADGGDGTDNCDGLELILACEGTAAPPLHPLAQPVVQLVEIQRAFNF